ncbi:MAG TPA: hypothetical protein ENH94_04700 [Phycisphaerales bacterium]|nr:hypothetical protein [Phycisphaerales bacterium]
MKSAKILLVTLLFVTLINAVRLGDTYPLPRVLPFMHGMSASKYDLAGIIMLIIFFWGTNRLRKNRKKTKHHKSRNPKYEDNRTGSDRYKNNYDNRYRQ